MKKIEWRLGLQLLLCTSAFWIAFALAYTLLSGCATEDDPLPYCSEIGCPPKPNDFCRVGAKCMCQPTPDVEPRACIYGEPPVSPLQ